jgi:hypothetical protein
MQPARPARWCMKRPKALTADQFERLKEELAAGFSGHDNAGRPMLLEGGLRWQSLSLTPADMDFAGLKAAAAREIALAFGVPPVLLGLPGDATYANYRARPTRRCGTSRSCRWRAKSLPRWQKGCAPGFRGCHWRSIWTSCPLCPKIANGFGPQVNGADFLTREEKRAMLGVAA